MGALRRGTFKELVEAEDLGNPSLGFVEGLNSLGEKLNEYRLTHGGFVPLAIFQASLAICGTYPCYEIVVRIVGDKQPSFMLKKRESKKEQGWGNLSHITGTAVRRTDDPGDVLSRLSLEIFGQIGKIKWEDLERIGDVFKDESPIRKALSVTPIFLLNITREQITDLQGEWREFIDLDDPTIVDVHRETLKWINEGPARLPVVKF